MLNNFCKDFRIVVILVICHLISHSLQTHQQCVLFDVLRTPGDCMSMRDCKYQIGRLKVGASVTRCEEDGQVCCPKGKGISERMCMKWQEMLYSPNAYDMPRLESPQCAHNSYLHRLIIVGGRDAYPFEYTHTVALGYGTESNKLQYLCGATLISENYLLTSATCTTENEPTYAIIGDSTLDIQKQGAAKSSTFRKIVKIASVTVHPEYRPPLIYNDIAIVQLNVSLELDRYLLPACIGNPMTTPPKKNSFLEASSWGINENKKDPISNYLQTVNLTTQDLKTCNQIYGLNPDKSFRYGIMKTQTCARGNDNENICQGDPGGGLYVREHPCLFHLVAIGSINGGKVCGDGKPTLYTTVASYQDWIESIVWRKE